MDQLTQITASKARTNLYNLLKKASQGLRSYEITLRGNDPVVLVSKTELESWLETLDIIKNPEEYKTIKKAQKESTTLSHADMLKAVGVHDKD